MEQELSDSNSSYTLYTDAATAWEAMLTDCKQAKQSIELEQFIFSTDEIGRRFIEVCEQKAREGVRVRFLWDSAGSWSLLGTFTADDLARRGIELVFFNTLIPHILDILRYRFWFYRNHRRSLTIDQYTSNAISYTGSLSMTSRVRTWRETHIRVTGEVVREITRAFDDLWNRATDYRDYKNRMTIKSWRITKDRPSGHARSQRNPISTSGFNYIVNNPKIRQRYLYHKIVGAISSAKKRIYITTPYFAPTHRILRTLRSAARRGVDVRLMLPIKSDHPVVDLCGRSYFTNLLKSKIKIYQYGANNSNPSMLHAKTIVIDDNWATVGTMNMDTISLLYNYEANIITTVSNLVKKLADVFENDIKDCELVDPVKWHNRSRSQKIFEWSARLLREFL